MPTDWLSTLLPIINAAGIPILAIAIVMLLRAYQKATDTYKDVSNHLRSENERLSNRLAKVETDYFSDYDKMKVTVSSSMNAIQELQARKIALLSQPENSESKDILTEVKKINNIIDLLQTIMSGVTEISSQQQHMVTRANYDAQRVMIEMGKLAEQIGDTKSRVAVLGVITSNKSLNEVKSEIDIQKRGIVAPTPPEKTLKEPESNKENLLDNNKSENSNAKGFASLPKYTEEEKNRKSS